MPTFVERFFPEVLGCTGREQRRLLPGGVAAMAAARPLDDAVPQRIKYACIYDSFLSVSNDKLRLATETADNFFPHPAEREFYWRVLRYFEAGRRIGRRHHGGCWLGRRLESAG